MEPKRRPIEISVCEVSDADNGWLMFHSVGKFSSQEQAIKQSLAILWNSGALLHPLVYRTVDGYDN